jgi:hypothetical protein
MMQARPGILILAGAAAVAALILMTTEVGQNDYQAEIEQWRRDREARLTSDEGWLTVAGLFWLKDGPNAFGSDPANDILLPAHSAPAWAGVFEHAGGRTTVRVEKGVVITSGGTPVTTMELEDDAAGDPDVLALGDLAMFVIRRGERRGIRLRDRQSRMRREFTGLAWYPVKEEYRIVADFVPYDPPRTIPVPNILGTTEMLPCPGYASFTLQGKPLRLEPVIESPGDGRLFFIFRDETSGAGTYPAARYLYAESPKDAKVVLDFNQAYNPPCAFTPYATCPLPPPQNRLAVRVEAGEKDYGHH